MKKLFGFLLLIPILLNAEVGELALQEFKDTFTIEFQSYPEYFETSCGRKIPIELDYKNLAAATSEEDRRAVGATCGAGLNVLAMLCNKGENYKKIVNEKINAYSCKFAGKGAGLDVTLTAGKLNWSFEYETPNHDDFINKKLLELL